VVQQVMRFEHRLTASTVLKKLLPAVPTVLLCDFTDLPRLYPRGGPTDEKTLNRDRRVTDADPSLQASMSRVGGWAFAVSPCPGRSLPRPPIGMLTPQCASLVLLFVSGATARHRSPQQPDRFCSSPKRKVARMRGGVSHTHSGRSPTGDHHLSGSRFFCTSRSFFRCAIRRQNTQADSGF
jgi:hypothetical protein